MDQSYGGLYTLPRDDDGLESSHDECDWPLEDRKDRDSDTRAKTL